MKKYFLYITVIIFFFLGNAIINAQSSINKTEAIEKMLAKKRAFNNRYGYGFKIQLYNGIEKEALAKKVTFENSFPGVYTKLTYSAPEWKVQVGNYKTRLEADKALMRIREKFSGAIVIRNEL